MALGNGPVEHNGLGGNGVPSPHSEWEDASGGRAELMVTVREPYWRLKTGQDEVYRQRLEIP